jgi:ABC-2 type transport system permease protein
MTAARQTWYMTMRHVMALWRQPWWIAVTLVQPVIWLLLYGALFKRVVEIPGFHGGSYIGFLAPGVVMMTAVFSAGWGGMSMIEDLDRGVIDRFLVSPVRRSALITGRVLQSALSIAIQALIIVGLALLVGADLGGGAGGVAALVVVAALLGTGFGALSNGLALVMRREESLIAVMQFLLLPLTFVSSAFMQADLAPGWIRDAAGFNPVNWAVEAGREAVSSGADWGLVAERAALLAVFAAVCAAFATRAFRRYQRAV